VDLWARDHSFLQAPLWSPAVCASRCEETKYCQGWTYFPLTWAPRDCALPLAVILELRYTCLLRASMGNSPRPHRGLVWAPRNCTTSPAQCLMVDSDRVAPELRRYSKVHNVAACRALCEAETGCKAFAYFTAKYDGEADARCILPPTVLTHWSGRCLLKGALAPADGRPAYLPIKGVVSGSRGCWPARPWSSSTARSMAVDGDYSRERCIPGALRLDFDAAYVVSGIFIWPGRPRQGTVQWHYHAATFDADGEHVIDGEATVTNWRAPVVVVFDELPGRAVRTIEIRTRGRDSSLCEVEAQVEPLPCWPFGVANVTVNGIHISYPEGRREVIRKIGSACERFEFAACVATQGGPFCEKTTHGHNESFGN